ncbi:MAG: ribose-5-phosphate isomerase RpiA [Betaproteobacteria bacterium]|nr:ribose-5-phosphate isomerase RpiA [Betaproteobacteria bacterium]
MSQLSSQDALKAQVAQAALAYVQPHSLIGVGTGSTVNFFIDALAQSAIPVQGAVSSSIASTLRMQALGIQVVELSEVESLSVYIDGADEIDGHGFMVKGGGAALTREKIVAAQAKQFVCIVDHSKRVDVMGAFPLPVEVIPMAVPQIIRDFSALGGHAVLRMRDDKPLVTDNGQYILDVHGLKLTEPMALEARISQWPGVVTVGIFAFQKADICLLATPDGVQTLRY